MSGMTRCVVRALTAMVVAAGSLASLAGPAQAYDNGTCARAFGAGNVADIDTVRVDTGTAGKVDFGDNLHRGGRPQGAAVVCWATNGRVAVVGRVFADSGATSTCASAQITSYNNGRARLPYWYSFCGNSAGSKVVSEMTGAGNYNRVRIRLYAGGMYADGTLVHTCNRYRGD